MPFDDRPDQKSPKLAIQLRNEGEVRLVFKLFDDDRALQFYYQLHEAFKKGIEFQIAIKSSGPEVLP